MKDKQALHMNDQPIDLHVFPDPWGLNPSPFCLKVETYCRLAGIPFTSVPTLPFSSPRGKLPFLSSGTERVPDSGIIIAWLKQRFGDRLDGDLNGEQRALGHLIQRCCEESLYFVLLYERWITPEGWQVVKPAFFSPLPFLLRDAVASFARRSVQRALHGQGYGRHTRAEALALGVADVSAIATMLAARNFAVADHPTSYDAVLYAFLANILHAPLEGALKGALRRHENLVAHVDRMSRALSRTEG
jgi:glutathione S-transferase